ncbi:MAG: glycosyltransferase, partial [Ignavibacteriales bacterium]
IKGKLKVGIVWSGNPQHTNDSRRSCRLKHFEDLFELENIQFYSIQVGPASGQVEKYGKKIIDLEVINEDGLAGTAAILSCMDLLISVDTSVAHLAGALGKRTWILLPFLPDWRWMLERRDSPWYPSVKLYRQEAPGDWKSILDKVKCELISETENAKPDRLPQLQETIYLALSSGENFGWGICSKYIKEELSKKVHTLDIAVREELKISTEIPGTVIHALNNPEFDSLYPVRGTRNFGYTFFEYELNQRSVRNAEKYDLVIGGSSWNKDKMIEKGITNADYLIQGIDPKYFYPAGIANTDDLFVIFSGGKFELRKGQDLVLKAVKILQQKYSDIVLINAWYNKWPSTMESMQLSKYIDFEYSSKEWEEFIAGLLHKNGLDKDRIITLPIVPNREMRDIYLKSDIGLFPNRCEGGTNLVMMEYMACGKPVIASFNTGHMDILTDENSIPLKTMHEFRIYNSDKTLIADWSEPDLDEIITEVERAYFNRKKIRETGYCAGEYMKQHTWSATAEKLLKLIT